MKRQVGVSRVKLQALALCPQAIPFLNVQPGDRNTLQWSHLGRDNYFAFDKCFMSESGDVLELVKENFKSIVNMVIMGYDSTVLLYGSQQTEAADEGDASYNMRIMTSIMEELFRVAGSSTTDGDTGTATINISFSEIFDNQVRDLGKSGQAADLRVREGPQNTFVEGLTSIHCSTFELFREQWEYALQQRTVLVVGNEILPLKAHPGPLRQAVTVLGEVSTVVVDAALTLRTVLPRGDAVVKHPVLKVVWLAPSDILTKALETKAPKAAVSLKSVSRYSKRTPIAFPVGNDLAMLVGQLRGSLKSLTTLVRVVHTLSRPSEVAPGTAVGGEGHVPFRDSLLTRLLRCSLRGNCFLTLLVTPNLDPEQANRALRFASEIGKLFNTIWINEEIILHESLEKDSAYDANTGGVGSEAASRLAVDSTLSIFPTGSAGASESAGNNGGLSVVGNAAFFQFESLQMQMNNELSQLSAELDRLEAKRLDWMNSAPAGLQLLHSPARPIVRVPLSGSASSSPLLSATSVLSGSPASRPLSARSGTLTPLLSPMSGSDGSPSALGPLPLSWPEEGSVWSPQLGRSTEVSLLNSSPGSGGSPARLGSLSPLNLTGVASKSSPGPGVAELLLSSSARARSASSPTSALRPGTSAPRLAPVRGPSKARRGSLLTPPTVSKDRAPLASTSVKLPAARPGRILGAASATPLALVTPPLSQAAQRVELPAPFDPRVKAGALPPPLTVARQQRSQSTVAKISESDAVGVEVHEASGRLRPSPLLLSPPVPSHHGSVSKEPLSALVMPYPENVLVPDVKSGVGSAVDSDSDSDSDSGGGGGGTKSDPDLPAAGEAAMITLEPACSADLDAFATMSDASEDAAPDENSDRAAARVAVLAGGSPPMFAPMAGAGGTMGAAGALHGMSVTDFVNFAGAVGVDGTAGAGETAVVGFGKKSNYSLLRAQKSERDGVEIEDDEGDGLTALERSFLRNVSNNMLGPATSALREGVNVHVTNTFTRDAMQIAARNGCVPMLQLLHEHGGELFGRGPRGETLLHLAAYNGHVAAMRWLYTRGLLHEAVDMYGQAAAHTAARRGELAVLRFLHEELGADVLAAEDFDGRTPLDCVPRRGPAELQLCREYLLALLTEQGPHAVVHQQGP